MVKHFSVQECQLQQRRQEATNFVTFLRKQIELKNAAQEAALLQDLEVVSQTQVFPC